MNIKKLLIALVVAAVAVGTIFVVLPKNEDKSVTAPADGSSLVENPSDGGSGEGAGLPTYTMAQVAAHDSKDDCWTVINDSVYNITSYIPRHDGGDEILRACGIDATSLFTHRKTADGDKVGSGTPHSSEAAADLARLKIGELVK